jgi:hypothetical protein
MNFAYFTAFFAQVAELADALDSGSSGRKVVEVRILSWAPQIIILRPFPDFLPWSQLNELVAKVPGNRFAGE